MNQAVMVTDPRQERGKQIAERMRIRKQGGAWIVPSAATPKFYTVKMQGQKETCTCPDFELRGVRCKHAWAVQYARRTETMPDGSEKVTETLRISYSQQWSAYNAAQCEEIDRAAELLHALCAGITEPPQANGRPRLPLRDTTFAAVLKVYGGMSARRSTCDMEALAKKGYMRKAPHFNNVLRALENPALTPILRSMLQESAAPLAAVESTFAVDSTGFSTCTYRRWYDEKYGREHSEANWTKAHICIGTKTNVITDAVVTDEASGGDCPQLVPLLDGTAQRFSVTEMAADKAYLSRENQQAIVDAGATPYIPFKTSSKMQSKSTGYKTTDLWKKLFGYFLFQREEFLSHYHARSNVESTFSAVKRKFGAALKSKSFTAQVNETYAKLLCFNLSVLVHEIHELGIEPLFWRPTMAAPNPPSLHLIPGGNGG